LTPKPKGLAARAGHWSARHRKTAIFGWLAFIVIAFVIGGMVGQEKPSSAMSYDGESRRAEQVLEKAGFPETSGEMVLLQSKTASASDKEFKAAITDVSKSVAKQKNVADVAPALVSKDGHSALVQFNITGDPEKAIDKVEPILATTASVAARHTSLTVEQFGNASMMHELDKASAKEEQSSNMRTMIFTLIILALTFGADRRLGPADPRDHRDLRHHGRRRPRQPADADGRHRAAGDHADRPRGRRRLLAVLCPP
jgi:RND superfamily putative drug exporter